MKTIKREVRVVNHGTIYAVHLDSRRAKKWWGERVNDGLEFGEAKIVEHRFIQAIVDEMLEDGLAVGGP